MTISVVYLLVRCLLGHPIAASTVWQILHDAEIGPSFVQEAHEAIRPAADSFRTPNQVRGELSSDERRLYELTSGLPVLLVDGLAGRIR